MSERIAVFSTSYPREPGDAAGHFVHGEVRRLLHQGHEVHVFAPGAGAEELGATLHWVADRGAFGWPGALARLKEQPTRWLGVCEFALRAGLEFERAGPFSRVQAHFLLPSGWPLASFACRAAGGPALELIGHGSDVRLFCALPRRLRTRIARGWLERNASLRVTSFELAELIRSHNPELLAGLRVEPSPLELGQRWTRGAARQTLGIAESVRVAVIVSRLVPEKCVDRALTALALLDPLSVFVVGDGPELQSLKARFPAACFVGYVPRPEALRFMAAADVLVSASTQEGAPSVVREARALGVPVVSLAAGDLSRWAERDPGLLVVRG